MCGSFIPRTKNFFPFEHTHTPSFCLCAVTSFQYPLRFILFLVSFFILHHSFVFLRKVWLAFVMLYFLLSISFISVCINRIFIFFSFFFHSITIFDHLFLMRSTSVWWTWPTWAIVLVLATLSKWYWSEGTQHREKHTKSGNYLELFFSFCLYLSILFFDLQFHFQIPISQRA